MFVNWLDKIRVAFYAINCYNSECTKCAPIAQRIEHWPPEPGAQVRVLLGAPFLYFRQIRQRLSRCFLLGFLLCPILDRGQF